MAFCPNCGNQIDDKAVLCVNCGTTVTPVAQQGKDSTGMIVEKVFMILGCVGDVITYLATIANLLLAFGIVGFVSYGTNDPDAGIPLLICGVMAIILIALMVLNIVLTISYFKKRKAHQPLSTGFKVLCLIFVNLVAGILMFTATKDEL